MNYIRLYNTIKYKISFKNNWRNLKYGIKNLIAYFKLIWNDRDYDYVFWLKMNRLKFSRMENTIRNHGNHVDSSKDADNINDAIKIIDRMLEDNYHERAFMLHDKKWGELQIDWKDSEYCKDCKEAQFNRAGVNSENEEQERQEFIKCSKHEQYLREQDLKYLTKIINKYLFTWWN